MKIDEEKIFNELKNKKYSEEEMKKEVEKARKKSGNLGNMANEFMTLLSMLKDYWRGEFYISKMDIGIIMGAVAYVVMPIDAVPDIVPALGFIDDMGVVAFVIKKLRHLIMEYKEYKNKV